MELVLLRHGFAEGRGADPPLTAEGVEGVRATIEGLAGLAVARVVHSPLLRARQTAALILGRWPDAEVVEDAVFVPGADPDSAARHLLDLAAGSGTLVLVSHLPLLPGLCSWLSGVYRDFAPADALWLVADDALAWRGTFELRALPPEHR